MTDKTDQIDDSAPVADDALHSRRELLMKAGSLATYVAPAMTVLISSDIADAHHRPWHRRGGWRDR